MEPRQSRLQRLLQELAMCRQLSDQHEIGKIVTSGANQITKPFSPGILQHQGSTLRTAATVNMETCQFPLWILTRLTLHPYVTAFMYFDIDTSTDNSDCTYSGTGACLKYEGADPITNPASNYTVGSGALSSLSVNKSQDAAVTHSDGGTGQDQFHLL